MILLVLIVELIYFYLTTVPENVKPDNEIAHVVFTMLLPDVIILEI